MSPSIGIRSSGFRDDESCGRFVQDLQLEWRDGDEERLTELEVFDLRRTLSERREPRRWPWSKREREETEC